MSIKRCRWRGSKWLIQTDEFIEEAIIMTAKLKKWKVFYTKSIPTFIISENLEQEYFEMIFKGRKSGFGIVI